MVKEPRMPFEEESAEDSVATDTTAESDQREEYDVEKILAEQSDGNGSSEYLVKWAGYEVQRASWEPRENFNNDHFFGVWNEEKKNIRSGKVKAFDVAAWQATQDRIAEVKFRRHQRRKAKRKRRGEVVSSDGDANEASEDDQPLDTRKRTRKQVSTDSEDDRPLSQARRKQNVSSAPPQRKGIARRADQSRQAVTTASMQNINHDSDPDVDSLFEEATQPTKIKVVKPRVATMILPKSPAARTATLPAKTVPKPSVNKPTTSTGQQATTVSPRQPIARKSAPTPADSLNIAKKTPNIFATWSDTKKRRERVRVSGETRKDSTDPKFTRLSEQNRYQKYSVNEPAPNIDALTIVDPKTGRAQPPKVLPTPITASVRRGPEEIHSAYGRRNSPPAQRPRSRTPPSPPARKVSIPAPPAAPEQTISINRDTVDQRRPVPGSRLGSKTTVCRYWLQGHCPRGDRECWFAHREPSPPPPPAAPKAFNKKQFTCFFWRRDSCKYPDEVCEYAHHDTGFYTAERGPRDSVGGGPLLRNSNYISLPSPLGTSATMQSPLAVTTLESPLATSDTTSLEFTKAIDLAHSKLSSTTVSEMPRLHGHSSFDMRLEVIYQGQSNPTVAPAKLEMSRTAGYEDVFAPGNSFQFTMKHMVKASDLRNHMHLGLLMHSSSVGAIRPRPESHMMLETMASTCKVDAMAFVDVRSGIMTIVYPCKVRELEFLDTCDSGAASDAVFNFRMMESPFSPDVLREIGQPPVPPPEGFAVVIVNRPKVEFDSSNLPLTREGRGDGQGVFIFLSEPKQAEFAALADHLAALGFRVFNTPEAWLSFRQKYARVGLIIVHPDCRVWEIQGLHGLLAPRSANVKVIETTFLQSLPIPIGTTLAPQCRRMFPHGTVTLITDDIFRYQPDKANDILQWFLKETAIKPPGGEFSKIATRPGVKNWLYQMAFQHTNERGRQDARWMQLYESICVLCPLEAEDPFRRPNPLPSSHLVSEVPEYMPSLIGLWEKDEARATDMLVEWFAGWSAYNASIFRRFFVCYESRGANFVVNQVDMDPRGWAKKWHHIGVETPDALMTRFKTKK